MKKLSILALISIIYLTSMPSGVAAPSTKSTYISKLTSALKISWAQKYMGSEGFQAGNQVHLKNSGVIDAQIKRIKLVCALFDSGVKNKKSPAMTAKTAAAAILDSQIDLMDALFDAGRDEDFVLDYEFVQISAVSVGVAVYCPKYSSITKSTLVKEFNKLMDDYLFGEPAVLDEDAAEHFVTGNALSTLNQIWGISLNGSSGAKTLRQVTDEIYLYLNRSLGRRSTEQDITVGFQPGNSMYSFFTRLVYDQEAYDAIKQRLIYNSRN